MSLKRLIFVVLNSSGDKLPPAQCQSRVGAFRTLLVGNSRRHNDLIDDQVSVIEGFDDRRIQTDAPRVEVVAVVPLGDEGNYLPTERVHPAAFRTAVQAARDLFPRAKVLLVHGNGMLSSPLCCGVVATPSGLLDEYLVKPCPVRAGRPTLGDAWGVLTARRV